MVELPAGVGPHEGRECELLLSGSKPLAMFCDVACDQGYFPAEEFAPHVRDGKIIGRDYHYTSSNGGIVTRCLFYAVPGEEWRIEEAHVIQRAIFSGLRKATQADDIRLGQLLGYSDQEIQAYLDHVRHLRHLTKQL